MVRKFHYLGKEKMTNDHLLWEEEYYFLMNDFRKKSNASTTKIDTILCHNSSYDEL